MGRSRYKIYDEEYPYFVTSSVVGGYPIFSLPPAAQVILNGFEFLQYERNVTLSAYIIMENHIHFIARGDNLAEKIRLFKSYAARKIIDLLEYQDRSRILRYLREHKLEGHTRCSYQLWQEGYHPKQVAGHNMMVQKIEYIHDNPVKRGYVDKPEDWRYSSARNYLGKRGLIDITCYQK